MQVDLETKFEETMEAKFAVKSVRITAEAILKDILIQRFSEPNVK